MYIRYELYAEFVGEQSHIEGILWIQNLFGEVRLLIGVMMTHTVQPLCSRAARAGGTCVNYPDFFHNHQFHVIYCVTLSYEHCFEEFLIQIHMDSWF